MGDEQRLTPHEQIAFAREGFESATDFTVAVEEELALLDPETLELTNRFEELQAAAAGTELEPHLVGELIASEIEVRTGRCGSFADAGAESPAPGCRLAIIAGRGMPLCMGMEAANVRAAP